MQQLRKDWFCSRCGFNNLIECDVCQRCQYINPFSSPAPQQQHKTASSSNGLLIAIFVFVGFCGLCGVLGVLLNKSEQSNLLPPTSSEMNSRTAAPQSANTRAVTPAAITQAKIMRVRIVPFTNPQGRRFQMVMIDWRNTGTLPIAALFVRVDLYDVKGQFMSLESAASMCVFAAETESQKVQPSKTYQEPAGDGFVVVSATGNIARRANVEIVRADPNLSGN
jgi:hypothetical protein